MGSAPLQSGESEGPTSISFIPGVVSSTPFDGLWRILGGAAYGLTFAEFREVLLGVGQARNYGLSRGQAASTEQQSLFFTKLNLPDLVLARACAAGKAPAWEHFFAIYQQPLTRAAVAIARSETLGRDLADALYAELYGLTDRDGQRRCPLDTYTGSGSLHGWLRSILAQRHVDYHRRGKRETPLDDYDAPEIARQAEVEPAELSTLGKAVEEALRLLQPEERFILAAYYLDDRTLREIGQVLHVHEATISRKLGRVTKQLRKQVLKLLQGFGLSRRKAEEALGVDPRDLEINIKKIMQDSDVSPFQGKAPR